MSNAVSTTGVLIKRKTFSVAITTSSVANPSVITTPLPHGLVTGESATISGHAGSTPSINGAQVVTVLSPTTFSIPVNVTVAGAGGAIVGDAFLTIAEITKATPPGKSRNKIETSTHNDGSESYILGILRQRDMAFTVNYIASEPSHITMNSDIDNNTKATWQFAFPSGILLTGPGRVQSFMPADAPVDAAQQADIMIAWAGPVVQT